MKTIAYTFNKIAYVITILALGACSKSESISDKGDGTVATVEFALSSSEYESSRDFNRAATPYLIEESDLTVSRNTLDIGNDMLLIAELTEEPPVSRETTQARSTKDGHKAALETGDLAAGIRYRVVVYDNAGAFVRQQEYIRGSEASAPAMLLDGGKTYTFIVYSVNTAEALPEPTFVGGIQTLLASELTVAGNQDFMYFRRELELIGGPNPNRLDIVLKHRFSQITTIIDASQTGYNPVNITASFGPHSNTAVVSLGTGIIAHGTQTARSSVTTTFNTGTTTASYPTIINADANAITNYVIASLTIGQLTLIDLTPFTTLEVTPGVKYNLILRVTPTDEYIESNGLPAVRINGKVWMRHNLGADYSTVAEESPMSSTRFGTYFQWGRVTVVAQPTSTSTSNWSGNNAPGSTSWNLGTELLPVKNPIIDPCPIGFRVPTMTEAQDLVDNTIHTDMGAPFVGGSTRYTSAKVLTSNRNRNVSIVFPLQGTFAVIGNGFPYQPGGLGSRGTLGGYHTSTLTGNRPGRIFFDATSARISQPTNSNNAHRVGSYNIRCIAE